MRLHESLSCIDSLLSAHRGENVSTDPTDRQSNSSYLKPRNIRQPFLIVSKMLFTTILASFAFSAFARAQNFAIKETEASVAVRQDEALRLTCTGNEPWSYCRWNFYGRVCSRTLDLNNPYCNIDEGTNRIAWQGVPAIDHKCTILIAQPELRDSGSWTCQLIQDDNEVAVKSFKVTVYAEAVVRFESRPHDKMMVGREYHIECSGVGGVPTPDLRALVAPVDNDDDVIELEAVEDASDGMLGGTVTRLFRYVPEKTHRYLTVRCAANQEEIFAPSSVASDFEVVFAPLPPETPAQTPTFYITEGQIATVTLKFFANPAPSDENVIWHMVGQASNRSQLIAAGASSGRFEALPVSVEDTTVTATLHIYEASLEDILNYCYLEAGNELGRFEYKFTLAPMPITAAPGDNDGNDSDGLGVGAIVGIVIGCLLVVAVVIIAIFYCQKSKKFCFGETAKGKSQPQQGSYMSVEQRDNVAQNENARSNNRESYHQAVSIPPTSSSNNGNLATQT